MSPSVAPVRRSGSIARRNARSRAVVRTRNLSPPILSSLQYGRYGYRKIAELLRQAGWTINDKRVQRIWQREGYRNHVWCYDFAEDRTHDGRKYRILNVLDEFTHECLAICPIARSR